MTQSDSRSPNKNHTDSLATSESRPLQLRIKQRHCMTLKMDSRGVSGNRPEWSEVIQRDVAQSVEQ